MKSGLLLLAAGASTPPPAERLREHLDEFDALLDDMHAAVRSARAAVSQQLAPEAAAERHGLSLSPADRCAVLSAPLRAYEAELALKRAIYDALCARSPPPPADRKTVDPALVEEYHAKFVAAMVELFDRHKAAYGPPGAQVRII